MSDEQIDRLNNNLEELIKLIYKIMQKQGFVDVKLRDLKIGGSFIWNTFPGIVIEQFEKQSQTAIKMYKKEQVPEIFMVDNEVEVQPL